MTLPAPATPDRNGDAYLAALRAFDNDPKSPEDMTLVAEAEMLWGPFWHFGHLESAWRTNLSLFVAFISDHDRRPSQHSPERDERSLSSWWQKQIKRGDRLATARRLMLDAQAPGWDTPVRSEMDKAVWSSKHELLTEFLSVHGRFPTKYAADDGEAELGRWLGRQVSSKRLKPEQIQALDSKTPGWNSRNTDLWNHKADLLESFVAENRRLPRWTSDTPAENNLYSWLVVCTNAAAGVGHSAATFTKERRARLDTIFPGWEINRTNQGTARYRAWLSNAAALSAFRAENGRWPSSHSDDPEEARLGRWLITQRRRQPVLGSVAELDKLVPGWRGPDKHQIWAARAAEVADFVSAHGRLPSMAVSEVNEEPRLARWLYTQRQASAGGPGAGAWNPRRAGELGKLVPGWAGQGADGQR